MHCIRFTAPGNRLDYRQVPVFLWGEGYNFDSTINCDLCAYEIIPTEPMHRWKVGYESARKIANVSCRFHDLRHTFISRLAESQASDLTVMALAGHVSRAMMERYSHIRMEAKRKAVDTLSGADFEPGVAQNWAQFFVSEKSGEAISLKASGEPGRTRTCNPLIKSQLLYH
jgi:Phage integrase family